MSETNVWWLGELNDGMKGRGIGWGCVCNERESVRYDADEFVRGAYEYIFLNHMNLIFCFERYNELLV